MASCLLILALLTALPFIVKHQLVSFLHSYTQRTVLLEDIDINPFTLEFRIKNFTIQANKTDHPFIAFDELYFNASWISLFQMGIIVDELSLKHPYVYGEMFSNQTFNFSDLIPKPVNSTPKTPAPIVKTKPLRFDQLPILFNLKQFSIINGSVDFVDKPHNVNHRLKQFNLEVNGLSNNSNAKVHPTTVSINLIMNNLSIDAHVRAHIFQEIPKAKMILRCDQGDFAFYQPYISEWVDWKLAKAILKAEIGMELNLPNGVPDVMVQGDVAINQFNLIDSTQKPLLEFPSLAINFKSFPLKSTVYVSSLKWLEPVIQVTQRKNKSLNLIPALKKQPRDDKKKKEKKVLSKNNVKKTLPPDVHIEKLMIEKGHIMICDQALKEPFQTELKNVQLKLKQIDLLKQDIPSIQFKTDILPHGKIDLNGAFDLSKMKWKGGIEIKDLDISMVQPYIEPFINGRLESGRLFLQMDSLVYPKKESPHAEISGTISINHLAFREPVKKNELLVWEQFQIKKFNCGFFPHYIDIDEIRMSQLEAPLFLQTNGNLNWLSLMNNSSANDLSPESKSVSQTTQQDNPIIKPSTENSPQTTSSQSTPFERLSVRKIILENSIIRFVDLTMTPAFQAHMSQLNGQVLGFDQNESKSMDFVFNGTLNDLSQMKIVGQLSPFQKPLSLKVDIRFDGIEVPVFTTYTSHYIGYPIDKGQLTLNLDYIVEKNQLISTNKFTINQLELGDKNENAKIPSLPIKFALALLKDREGKIKIDIPVQGNLDSLDFSLKNVILQTLQNLLERMVTSPFSFLSRLYGYSEDMEYIEFDYGKTDFTPSNLKKIKQVSKMMTDRPLLKLQFFSHVNIIAEEKAFKRIQLNKELELLKFKDQASLSETGKMMKRSILTDKEYDHYLIQLYQSFFKKMPPPEFQNRKSLEPTLLSTIDVVSEDIEALALKRMVMIRNTLVDDYNISPDRIFIQEKKPSPKELKNINQSQVVLKLE